MDKSKQNCELVELVLMHNTSIRLRNCMLSAQKSGQLPFTTLDEYISAGNEALRMLLKIPNLGKNTALEFDSLVKNADLKKMYRMESTIKQEPVKEDLSSPLHKLVLADVASYLIGHIDDHIANRIINVLEDIQTSEKLRLCPLSIYLTETNPIRFLMKQANIGNSSAVKFNEFINKLVNNTIDHISIQEIYDDKYAVEKGKQQH